MNIRPTIFSKSIIGLIQIGGGNSYFCRLKFKNIKIIIYIKGNFNFLDRKSVV